MSGASSGSGFIISEDGYIVTNAHVVAHNSAGGQVVITQWNGKKREGKIHSLDTATDICLIKLSDVRYNEELPVATLGSSSKLRTGEFVVALGSPLMLTNSVTFGIVSSTARQGTELGMRSSRLEYIQTDASINQGNSGGPLVNLDGHVVGINNMKLQGGDGISFAIPIDLARQVVGQLKAHKKVIRPYIGINMTNFNPVKRRRFSRDDMMLESTDVQVLVTGVEKGSPADQAGLRINDVVVAVDGKPLKGVHTLLHAIGIDIGRRIELKVQREGSELTVHVTTAPDVGSKN
jgi:HtrA serine peptidase 2